MSIGNNVIDKIINSVVGNVCYDPQPFLEQYRNLQKETKMPDDLGYIENRLFKAINPIKTGYKEIDEIVKRLDNDEIEIASTNHYGNNFAIFFVSKRSDKEVGYRELATLNKEDNPSVKLAIISKQANFNKIKKAERLSNVEIKLLITFCNNLHNKILPKFAKKGYTTFSYYLPYWFHFIFNKNKDKNKVYFQFISNQLKTIGYEVVQGVDYAVRIVW